MTNRRTITGDLSMELAELAFRLGEFQTAWIRKRGDMLPEFYSMLGSLMAAKKLSDGLKDDIISMNDDLDHLFEMLDKEP